MKNNSLIVSEVFYSLQGEGQTMGIPSVFLRLAGCNLFCNSAAWRCDTIEVWQKGVSTPFENIIKDEWIQRLRKGAHLIITGGEPLLHQESIKHFIYWIELVYQFTPIVEIETNGTIFPTKNLLDRINYWNCSPKLKSSGADDSIRSAPYTLKIISELGKNVCFKYVISSDDDILEILESNSVPLEKIIFMPAGATQDELNITRPFVAEKCIFLGIKYCDRLHVVIWNKKTGV